MRNLAFGGLTSVSEQLDRSLRRVGKGLGQKVRHQANTPCSLESEFLSAIGVLRLPSEYVRNIFTKGWILGGDGQADSNE
jgi:hypothetical protein